jgi:hypothetical protein
MLAAAMRQELPGDPTEDIGRSGAAFAAGLKRSA